MCSQLNEDEDDVVDDDLVDEDEDYDIYNCNALTKKIQQNSSNGSASASDNINDDNVDCKNVYNNENSSHYYRSSFISTPTTNNNFYSKNLLYDINVSNNKSKQNHKNC